VAIVEASKTLYAPAPIKKRAVLARAWAPQQTAGASRGP
jgi:hypothetical protein